MLNGILIAFLLTFVIGISIAVVIMVVLREVTSHIYEGSTRSMPIQGFRSHLRRFSEEDESGGRKASRHTHYHA